MKMQKFLLVMFLVGFSASSYAVYIIDSCSISPEEYSIPSQAVELCSEQCFDNPDPVLNTPYNSIIFFGEASYLCRYNYFHEEGDHIRGVGEVSDE